MRHVIPVDTLAELADVSTLSNVIRTVDGNHSASAADIADGIADSGFLHNVVTDVATRVQIETARRAAEVLTGLGFSGLADQITAELVGAPDFARL